MTFKTWRDIFWMQTALAGTAAVLCFFLQPETIHEKRAQELQGLPTAEKAHKLWQWLNPFRVIRLYRYPNILLTVSLPITSNNGDADLVNGLSHRPRWCGTCTPS